MTRTMLIALTALAALACAPDAGGDDDDDDVSDDTGGGGEPSHFQLYVNEFMASNASVTFDGPDGEPVTPDWIELYNPSGGDVDLTGFTITDDLEEPALHALDGVVLPAHGWVVLFADQGAGEGAEHLPFKLGKDEDAIGLFDPDGRALDRITYTGQVTDVAAGRIPDGGELQFLPEATPGAANPTEAR